MKNTFKFMFVALAMTIALASCGGKTETTSTETTDTVATEVAAPVDTTATPADTTAAQ